MSRLTFSRAELVRACGYWLRSDAVWSEDASSPYAAGGTRVHRALAILVAGGVLELPEEPELRALYARGREWLLEHRTGRLEAEAAFAYDLETGTGRRLEDPPGAGARWYADATLRAKHGVRETEVCGRVDLLAVAWDEHGSFARIADYKCHFGPEWLDARAQLELSALAVARALGVDRVQAVGVHLWTDIETEEEWIGEHRRNADGEPYGRPELGPDALRAIAEALAFDVAEAEGAQPTEGAHCMARYCPARLACPVTQAAVDSAVALIPAEQLARRHSFATPATTAEHGAWKLAAIALVRERLEAEEAEVKALADRLGGIVLSDGRVYGARVQPRESPILTVPGALEVLQDMGLDFAVEPRTSWEAIAELAGSARAKQARAALRAIGATKRTEGPVYAARKAERAKGAA